MRNRNAATRPSLSGGAQLRDVWKLPAPLCRLLSQAVLASIVIRDSESHGDDDLFYSLTALEASRIPADRLVKLMVLL